MKKFDSNNNRDRSRESNKNKQTVEAKSRNNGRNNYSGNSNTVNLSERTTDGNDYYSADENLTYKGEIYFSNPPKPQAAKPSNSKKSIRQKIRKKETKTVIAMMFVIVVSSIILSSIAISCVKDIIAINRSNTEVTVKIPSGASTNQIIRILDNEGLIQQSSFCELFMSLVSKLKNSDTPVYQNGTFIVQSSMGIEGMLNEFKEKQESKVTVRLVFPEGWSISQIFGKISEFGVCETDYLYTALNENEFTDKFIPQVIINEKQALKLEGYFFPDTYDFYEGENANSVIKKFFDNFNEKWSETYTKRAEEIGMSMDEIIVIASIIQKEAANTEQMKLVSSVIHNRLIKSSTFPSLDCNSTRDYISALPESIVGNTEENEYLVNYNTYSSQGLPPGPICNPGINAIEAALYPKETDYYYFQHDKNRKIYMAKTLTEQYQNTMEVYRVNGE